MAVNVRVERKFSRSVDSERLARAAKKTMQAEGVPLNRAITIAVVSDESIHSLNRQYHHVDRATDVLAFNGDGDRYLGDVVVSFETALANAHSASWSVQQELELLTVHGVLHLLGYDDSRPRSRARMWRRQESILGTRIPETR